MSAPHGTYERYMQGCLEECCDRPARAVRMARAALMLTAQERQVRRATLMRPFAGWSHGRRATYIGGCRCADCREAARIYQNEYRAKRRESQGSAVLPA